MLVGGLGVEVGSSNLLPQQYYRSQDHLTDVCLGAVKSIARGETPRGCKITPERSPEDVPGTGAGPPLRSRVAQGGGSLPAKTKSPGPRHNAESESGPGHRQILQYVYIYIICIDIYIYIYI